MDLNTARGGADKMDPVSMDAFTFSGLMGTSVVLGLPILHVNESYDGKGMSNTAVVS